MSEIMQILDVILKPTVFVFTVSSLFAMGLQVKIPDMIAALKNKKAIALIFVWAWVLAPALGYLIIWVLPLAEPYVIVVLLSSLAPAAPVVPLMVQRARGDLSFAGVFIPVVMVGAVVLIPLIGPLMVKGLTVSSADLAKPLFVQICLPLVIGAAARHYAGDYGNEDLSGGQCVRPARHIGDDRGGLRALCPADARDSWQLCPPRCDNSRGRDDADNVSIRFRPETESTKRHGAG